MSPNKKSYKLMAFGDSIGDKELIDFSDRGYMNYIK
jgi:hypothetical protein